MHEHLVEHHYVDDQKEKIKHEMAHYHGHDHEYGEEKEHHYSVEREIVAPVRTEDPLLTHAYHVIDHQHYVETDSDSDSDSDSDDEVVQHEYTTHYVAPVERHVAEQHEVIEEVPYRVRTALEDEIPYGGWMEHHVAREYVPEPIVHSHPVHHHWTEEHHAVEADTAHDRHLAEYQHGDEHKL